MKKAKSFFDYDEPKSTLEDPPGMIRGVPFVDSPQEGEAQSMQDYADELPYIPSGKEWAEMKAEMRRTAIVAGFAIGLSALTFIFAICALVTK